MLKVTQVASDRPKGSKLGSPTTEPASIHHHLDMLPLIRMKKPQGQLFRRGQTPRSDVKGLHSV